jgi:signal transduction histidine kinase
MSNKGKVLAVDDTPANLEVIGEILGDAGYIVATALDGERAIKRLQHYQPDLILLDIQMPGMNGFETCAKLKANLETASIPIIFITALSDVESKVKGFAVGGVDYITKPFQEKELLARVETHLQLRKLNQSLEEKVAERTVELQTTLNKLHHFQLQLVQSEKMSALGNLVSGIAHEINNPLGAIIGNSSSGKYLISDLLEHLQMYRDRKAESLIKDHEKAINLEYLLEDLPQIMDSINISCNRIAEISRSLSIFSRKDEEHKTLFDIHQGIDSTLLILKYRLKANEERPEIKIIKQYSDLPQVECYAGQLNQVFMNLLTNAIDAFEEVNKMKSYEEIESNPNQIKIETSYLNDSVKIQISDNGSGMTPEVRSRIFEQGFTTKKVGKGTGLGMAIAHQIITEKHGGMITCSSDLGKGTKFVITLPSLNYFELTANQSSN